MDRKTFLWNLAAAPALAVTGKCDTARCSSDAAAVRGFLSEFVWREEGSVPREVLIKLLEERGRACCRALDFRQKLIQDSQGVLDKLVELMGKIVGAENCRRDGNRITLTYPSGKCGCGWSPKREPIPDDPYCECSRANNQLLFETVTGKPVRVEVADSPRRHAGARCRFVIDLA
jgi:hypothetical protein